MEQAKLNPFLTHWNRLCEFLECETFPPGHAEDRDAYMHAQGLLQHYSLQHTEEANANKAKVQQSTSRTNKIQNYPAIRLPCIASFSEAAAAIIAEPTFEKADTIIVLTDTDDLSSTRILKHFEKLGPLLYDRTTVQGPYSEQWTIAFHRIEGHDHKIHCTWAAVFLIEALITAVPWKHYILQDHDDAPLALYEIQQLVNLVKAFHLPYFSSSDAHPGMIIMNEESTPANAGQVFFPARETRKQTARVEASWIHQKIRQDRDQLTTRKLQAPQTITVDTDGRVREINQPPSNRNIISPFTQTIEQLPTPHTKPQDSAWEHLHEDKLRLLGGTPFYRSQAESAADYIHAWAMIGTAACALGFTEENNKDKSAHCTYIPEHLQRRTPPLTVWAGPFFEQAHLCSLNALDSYKCFSATLPGPNFFMQKNLQLKEGEHFLQNKQNPFEKDSVLFPAGIHAHGKRNKDLLVLLVFTQWMPLDIALAGIGRAVPFFCRNQDSVDLGLAAWMRSKCRLHSEKPPRTNWHRVCANPWVSSNISANPGQQPLLATRYPIFVSDICAESSQPNDLQNGSAVEPQHADDTNQISVFCNGLDSKKPAPENHDVIIGNRSGFRQCYGLADRKREDSSNGFPSDVKVSLTPNHITDANFLFYNMPATAEVWELLNPNIRAWTKPTLHCGLPSWLSLPDSHYLLALALQINHLTPKPVKQLSRILDGHFTHHETIIDDRRFFSLLSPIVPEIRQQFSGQNSDAHKFTHVNIEGFSAGSLIGMSIFRLLAETGNMFRAMPSKVTLGAIAMPPLLFFNFFEAGRAPLPSVEENARQSAWKREKTLWKGATFVHYLKDAACPFTPSKIAQQNLFHNNAHKLVLLTSRDQQYGKSGHNYGHEYLALASLQGGVHEVHAARMQSEVGDTNESLAMLMVNLILTMGTQRLHSLLKDLIDASEEGSLQELTQQAKFVPTEQEHQVLNLMAAATTANTKKHTAWLWGTILPSISSRAAADAAEKGHSSVPLYHASTEIEVTLKFDHKLAHNAFLVYVNITGGQNEWAIFETQQNTASRNRHNKVDYQTGIYAGDVLTFKAKFKPWLNWPNPVPEFVQCQAFVIRKNLRRRQPTAQADVQSMQLAIRFPEQLELERWEDGSKELVTQYNANIKDISKLTKLPTPNAWALLTQLPEAQLALLSQNTVTCNANDWASPARPKAETAAKCFKLMEKQLKVYDIYYKTLRKFITATKSQGRLAEEIRSEVLQHAFQWFGHDSGTDWQNINLQANERGPYQDRIELLELAMTHPWVCLAYYSPIMYLDMLQLFLSEDETFKLLIAHIVSNAHLGALATHIQGIAGAGKTFQVMAVMTACHYLADINTLWVTKLNNPLYTAALAAQRYLPKKDTFPTNQIIRVLATSHDDHTTPIDIQRTTKGHQWPSSGIVILTSGLAATYLDFNPHLGEFFGQCDLVIFDEAQQFGAEDEAILFTTLPATCMFVFIGDPEQPTGSASSHFAQLVIQRIARSYPGLRSTNITFRAGREYISNYFDFLQKTPAQENTLTDVTSLLSQLLEPLFDNANSFDLTNFHKIGWAGIGGLVIPYCVRCHDLNTLLWAPLTYHSLFKGPNSKALHHGFLSPVTILSNSERLLLKPESIMEQHFRRTYPESLHLLDSQSSTQAPDSLTETDLPAMTSSAKERFLEPHRMQYELFPTNLLDWNDPTARSVSSNHTWLKSVECIVNTMVAFILMATNFSETETRAAKIGIFTPWLKVTKHLVSYYNLSQWLDHKNKTENPWDYLRQTFGNDWKNLSIETVARQIAKTPYFIRSILHIQTSITSASTTVTHALIIIPRHTRFTNNWAQGLVCLSRAQGTNFIFCPSRPPAGFFRYILPVLHKRQKTPKITNITEADLLSNLTQLDVFKGLSSLHHYQDQGLYKQQIFDDWPLAILLQVKKDLGDPKEKTTLCEHLLLAQIPNRLEGDNNPLLEWRLAPTSEENKAKPDIALSQVYLTFGRSRNSPSKDPTLRLWLAAKVEGKHKRILIADASVNFRTQLRATEVRLFPTERCMNPDLIFMVQSLPGIHFYQSNYPYQQIDQHNIWEHWQPSAKTLASTPGREAITPPPPSPRTTQETGTAEFRLQNQNPLSNSQSSLQVGPQELNPPPDVTTTTQEVSSSSDVKMDPEQPTHYQPQLPTTNIQNQQHHPSPPLVTQPLTAPPALSQSQLFSPPTTPTTLLKTEEERGPHSELEVDNTAAAQEEADYEDDDDDETAKQSKTPAEETTQNTEEIPKTWQNVGHGQYRKVEKTLTSKDEELNDEAAGLIEALTAQEPSYPSRLDEVIILSQVTSSTAWGALSIRVEDLDLIMRKRQLALHLFLQKPTAALDENSYTLYLAALLTDLFMNLDTQSFSPALAPIFANFKFWELQVRGALQLNDAIGVSPTKERILEMLRQSPTWLICRLLPSVKSVTASKNLVARRNIYLHVYLPLSAIANIMLQLRQKTGEENSNSIIQQFDKGELALNSAMQKACTCKIRIATPMSNVLQDLALAHLPAANKMHPEGSQPEASKPPAEVEMHQEGPKMENPTPPAEVGSQIPWRSIAISKRPRLSANRVSATRITIPFYKYWDIFDREPDQINTEITCFWNIANILSATTGTLQFLEKAIDRWTTVEPPNALSLQYEDEKDKQLQDLCSYTNSPEYRRSWEQWIDARASADQALKYLNNNGLFQDQHEDQQKERQYRNSRQLPTGKGGKDKRTIQPSGEDNKPPQGHKRARSTTSSQPRPVEQDASSHTQAYLQWQSYQHWQTSTYGAHQWYTPNYNNSSQQWPYEQQDWNRTWGTSTSSSSRDPGSATPVSSSSNTTSGNQASNTQHSSSRSRSAAPPTRNRDNSNYSKFQ